LKIICGNKLNVVLQSSADTLAGCVEKDTPGMNTINYSEASTNISQPPPPPPPKERERERERELWDSTTHVTNKSKQTMKTIHLPLVPTDIAVMLTRLPTGVSNVVTTMKNNGKSAVAWTVVPVPHVEEAGWAPGLLWMGVKKRKSFLYQNLHPQASSL
jgi:hypothetical protein